MTTAFRDFSGDTVGQAPANLLNLATAPWATQEVINDANGPAGRAFHVSRDSNVGPAYWAFTDLPLSSEKGEVYFEWYADGDNGRDGNLVGALYIRDVSGVGTGYVGGFRPGGGSTIISTGDPVSDDWPTSGTGDTADGFSTDVFSGLLQFENVSGGDIQVDFFFWKRDTESQPASPNYSFTTTTNNFGANAYGAVGRYNSGNRHTYFLYVSVGTDADSAPRPSASSGPSLTNATAAKDGTNGYTGSVDTDTGSGTLYHVVTTSSTKPTVAQVKAGEDDTGTAAPASGSQAISSTGTKNVSGSGLSSGTQYWIHYVQADGDGNDSSVVTSSSFTTDSGSDTTAPTLTNPTGTTVNASSADGSVDTDEANGTLYWVVTGSSTKPSVAQIQAGQDHNGTAAAESGNQAVSATGTQNVSATGLTAGATRYFHFQHQDDAANDSGVTTSASFTLNDLGWSTNPAIDSTTVDSITVTATPNGDCNVHGVAVPAGDPTPSAQQVVDGQDSTGSAAEASFTEAATADTQVTGTLSNLTAHPSYDVHVVGDQP